MGEKENVKGLRPLNPGRGLVPCTLYPKEMPFCSDEQKGIVFFIPKTIVIGSAFRGIKGGAFSKSVPFAYFLSSRLDLGGGL